MVTATKKLLGLGEPGPVRRLVNAGEGVDAYVIDWGTKQSFWSQPPKDFC